MDNTMFKNTTSGEWAVLGLSVLFTITIGLSKPLETVIVSLFFLYMIYRIVVKFYPKSQNWGAVSWVVALVGIPTIFIFILAGAANIFGMTGSAANVNQKANESMPFSTSQPNPAIANTYQPAPTNFVLSGAQPVTLQTTQTVSPYRQITLNGDQDSTIANKISQAIDYLNPTVKNFANAQVQKSSSGTQSNGKINIAQVGDVWQSINNQWTYVSDPPNFDYWTPASDSINNGLKGNCADFAVLNAAVVESIGGSARVVTACAPGGSPCHAYAEESMDPSELQSIADYIGSRYGSKQINYHTDIDSQGNTEYWLNLDWQADYPGGPFFKDDGTFNIYYPNGYHETGSDTTYSKNEPNVVPTITPVTTLDSIYPITVANGNFVNIPYNTNSYYSFNGNSGNIYHISVSAGSLIDILVMDQSNFNSYQNAFKSGSAISFNAVSYKSVSSKDFTYILPNSGTYYVVIDNSPFLNGGADAKTSVIASTKIILTGNF